MRIEVLYVPGCPNFQPAVERIEKVLVSESLRADIEGVPVNSDAEAKALQVPGSPTIRINSSNRPRLTRTMLGGATKGALAVAGVAASRGLADSGSAALLQLVGAY